MPNAFGNLLRMLREACSYSQRKFATSIGMDPSNYSRLERGISPPPLEEVLDRIVGGLGISRGSSEWQALVDAAHADRGRIPEDLLQNETIVAALPGFFQRLRTYGVSSDGEMYDLFASAFVAR